MHRAILALLVPTLAIVLTALAVAGPPEPLPALFSHEDCRRVDVLDRQQRAIAGIEDVALLEDGRVFVSAHNRRQMQMPVRGVYWGTLDTLASPLPILEELYGVGAVVRAVHPHGFAVDRSGTRLAVVNRGAPGRAEVLWGRLTDDFELVGRWDEGEATCRANDVAWRGAELVVTRDRESCGQSFLELLPGAASGSVGRLTVSGFEEMARDLEWANGVVVVGGRVFVAETRGARIVGLGGGPTVELPGGPDNLSAGPLDTILAAVHPDLFDNWLWTVGWGGPAPSRIVAVDPRTGGVEVLFDDPLGKVFPGATAAAAAQGTLIAGSAYGSGLLVCRRG